VEVENLTRNILDCPKEKLVDTNPYSDYVPRKGSEFQFSVITPIVGGGAVAGKSDSITPIRVSGIRGHLRFWWRVARGIECKSIKELREREGEIWGAADWPSPVLIEVEQPIKKLNNRNPPDHGFPKYGPQAYALFSAKDESILEEGFCFNLKVRWLKLEKLQMLRNKENEELEHQNKEPKARFIRDIGTDVEEALKAWANFGGIGTRTRRGCGALFCDQLAIKSVNEIKRFRFRALFNDNCDKNDPINAWSVSVGAIMSFRQLRGGPHDKKIEKFNKFKKIKEIKTIKGIPGRSYWPEPDTIRKITGCALKPPNLNDADHSIPLTPVGYFPRAELGLPIVFHFADGPNRKPAVKSLDPPDVMLIPTKPDGKDGTRMASPVITRPIKLATGESIALVVILNSQISYPLRLIGNSPQLPYDINQKMIRDTALANYPNSPLGPSAVGKAARSSDGSALEGFINFAEDEKHFVEVM